MYYYLLTWYFLNETKGSLNLISDKTYEELYQIYSKAYSGEYSLDIVCITRGEALEEHGHEPWYK